MPIPLRSLNFTDGLHHVRNRKYFDQKLRKEWERAQRAVISSHHADRSRFLQETNDAHLWSSAGDLWF